MSGGPCVGAVRVLSRCSCLNCVRSLDSFLCTCVICPQPMCVLTKHVRCEPGWTLVVTNSTCLSARTALKLSRHTLRSPPILSLSAFEGKMIRFTQQMCLAARSSVSVARRGILGGQESPAAAKMFAGHARALSGLARPMHVSPQLAHVLGSSTASRVEITKQL